MQSQLSFMLVLLCAAYILAVCDPVLGDEGKLYVSQELVAAYRATLLPLASLVTPNQFEAECLTGKAVKSGADALAAAAALHSMGPHTVVSRN